MIQEGEGHWPNSSEYLQKARYMWVLRTSQNNNPTPSIGVSTPPSTSPCDTGVARREEAASCVEVQCAEDEISFRRRRCRTRPRRRWKRHSRSRTCSLALELGQHRAPLLVDGQHHLMRLRVPLLVEQRELA